MLRFLVPLHRWLGVVFCLPVAMWFASGVVMHFVPFPAALTEAERLAGAGDVDLARVEHGPAEAVALARGNDATRVRLIQRSDGPVYLVSGPSGVRAVRATDLADGSIRSAQLALSIAVDYARGRGRDGSHAAVVGSQSHDQWTMSAAYDVHRPLYRIALNDDSKTDLYVSSAMGEIVLETTRWVRLWNYLGSVSHWIYFTGLRSYPAAWSALLWSLSFLALIGVVAGGIIGPLRLKVEGRALVSPFRGWQAWHHWLGLVCLPFLFTWLLSGWVSMDDGLLFPSTKLTSTETSALIGEARWNALSPHEVRALSSPVREVLWFSFGGNMYRREARTVALGNAQALVRTDEIDASARRLQHSCEPAFPVGGGDSYADTAAVAHGSVFRVACGSVWFDIDARDGAVEKIDASRRSYRWLHQALHRHDWPFLANHPALRTLLILALSAGGLIFSCTAVVIGWQRLAHVLANSAAKSR